MLLAMQLLYTFEFIYPSYVHPFNLVPLHRFHRCIVLLMLRSLSVLMHVTFLRAAFYLHAAVPQDEASPTARAQRLHSIAEVKARKRNQHFLNPSQQKPPPCISHKHAPLTRSRLRGTGSRTAAGSPRACARTRAPIPHASSYTIQTTMRRWLHFHFFHRKSSSEKQLRTLCCRIEGGKATSLGCSTAHAWPISIATMCKKRKAL